MFYRKRKDRSDLNTLIQEAIKLVEAGETEKGLNTLSKAENQLYDEDKAIAAQLYYEWGNVEKAISLISDLHDLYQMKQN